MLVVQVISTSLRQEALLRQISPNCASVQNILSLYNRLFCLLKIFMCVCETT